MITFLSIGFMTVIGGIVYLSFFILRFINLYTGMEITRTKKIYVILVSSILSLPAIDILSLYAVIYFHLLALSLVLEVIFLFLKRFTVYKFVFTTGLASILLTMSVMVYAYYNMNTIVKTEYKIETDKIEGLKILQISDLHMGNSISVEKLERYCQRMSGENPDIVFLTGDIFDENTTRAQMEVASQILGSIDNRLGIYYIYGNHEYMSSEFSIDDIRMNLEKHNITVLKDESITIDDIIIVGRNVSKYIGEVEQVRKTSQQLLKDVESDKYTIILDHIPLDMELNAELGADLQLSGHTHGGQIFPLGFVESNVTGGLVYGKRMFENFHAITSSGIAGWGYPIKTGARSEYVIVHVNK
jgi:Predicted phosphohydrolases